MDCGENSVKVSKKRSSTIWTVSCKQCSVTKGVIVKKGSEPFLAYQFFLDILNADEEVHQFETRVEELKRNNSKEEILLYYKTLRARCEIIAAKAQKAKGAVNLTLVSKWENLSLEYDRQLHLLEGEDIKVSEKRRDLRGYFLPYPYIPKPPSPPDDIGVATNLQRNMMRTGQELEVELFCRYCGSVLSMDESFCSVCGKKA